MANYISAHCVADYFLLQTDQNVGDALTNLKLQKLCYYSQAWHIAEHQDKLFSEKIKAWAHGPVIPDLWHRFKHFRWGSIDSSQTKTNPYSDLHVSDIHFLGGIWELYSRFSGGELEQMTHAEPPWKLAYGDRPLGAKCDAEITVESMYDYFSQKLLAA